jgi:hypothetical protein
VLASDAGHPFEVAEIAAESMGWQQLGAGLYLHAGDDNAKELLING